MIGFDLPKKIQSTFESTVAPIVELKEEPAMEEVKTQFEFTH